MVTARGNHARCDAGRIEPVREAKENLAALLRFFGNMGLCEDERLPGDRDDSLIRAARRVRRQLVLDLGSDVTSHNGEVAIFEFKNVRAALQPRGLRAAPVRVGTKSA